MIDELRATLDRHADDVRPRPEPYARVVRLRRRRRQQRVTVLAVVFVLLVTTPTIWLLTPPGDGPHQPAASVPAALLPLLRSPTRGSLAGDAAFLEVMRRRTAAEVGSVRGNPGDGPYMPTDPDRIKVLFAGDIGSRRYVLTAGMDGWPLKAAFLGDPGEGPEELYQTGSGSLEAAEETSFGTGDGVHPEESFLLLGPVGAVYEEGQAQWSSTGVTRTWHPVEVPDGYYAVVEVTRSQRLRVRLGDTVLREVQTYPADPGAAVGLDPKPYGGRGTAFPDVAEQVGSSLLRLTQLAGTGATLRVLWSSQVPAPGAAGATGRAATVQVVTTDGGGPYFTGIADADGNWRDHPTGSGFAAGPEQALIVMRLPSYAAEDNQRLQIIAPPAAVRAELVRDGQVEEVPLTKGAGWWTEAGKVTATVRAYDAAGNLLATAEFTDLLPPQCDRLNPPTCQAPEPAPSTPDAIGPTG
ncbi:hypothetical protein [Catellatospora coxensis]|uniref:Uncharacterized protein n=1 Tax=Catellatospora coxensis TaxID=310354 RepID=A0A8J3LAC3_9ACTN|nr:hypothetical protein [Catellatospora coxensis]GIG10945.1 hypothetical protein Cco03nite_76450 [Catellatospora coxensis]